MSEDVVPIHREGHITGALGRRLYWQSWVPARRARQLIVVIHGLGEHSGRYARLATDLVAQGCAVYALDLRGHGQSEGPRALFGRIGYVEGDIHAFMGMARKELPYLKPLLLGQSLGGMLALGYALKAQEALHGLILSAPAIAIPPTPWTRVLAARVIAGFRPRYPLYAIDSHAISGDAEQVRRYEQDPLICHDKIPARTLVRVLDHLAWLPATYPVLKLPLLILHGTSDRLAPQAGSADLYQRAGSTDKILKLYDGGHHELFNETPLLRERVLADLAAWLTAHPQPE